jgi:hypothetical protein
MGDSDLGAGGVGFWRAEAARRRAEAERLAGSRTEAQRLATDNLVLQTRVVELEGQARTGTAARTTHTCRPARRSTTLRPVSGVLVAPPVGKAIGKGRFTTGFLAGC